MLAKVTAAPMSSTRARAPNKTNVNLLFINSPLEISDTAFDFPLLLFIHTLIRKIRPRVCYIRLTVRPVKFAAPAVGFSGRRASSGSGYRNKIEGDNHMPRFFKPGRARRSGPANILRGARHV